MKEKKESKKVAMSQQNGEGIRSIFLKWKEVVEKLLSKGREFQKKQRKKRYENGEVELPVFRVGTNKRGIRLLWILMSVSLIFAIYKNFTAIDKETIHERTVVEPKVTDTNELESFVERFAFIYHSWGHGADMTERGETLNRYMTDSLAKLNMTTISGDCPTSSDVLDVRVCEVSEAAEGEYQVRYSVKQSLHEILPEELAVVEKNELSFVTTSGASEDRVQEEKPDLENGFDGTQTGETAGDKEGNEENSEVESLEVVEEKQPEAATKYQAAVTLRTESISNGDGSKTVVTTRESFYMVNVHMDENKSMVITTNPTACGVPGKSSYTVAERQSDGSVSTEDMAGIEDFLNTFFALYPKATEKELAYYAAPDVMDVIGADYVYDGLYSRAYYKEGDEVKAHVLVKYLDQTAKVTQLSEYTLTLEKRENWKIVKAE